MRGTTSKRILAVVLGLGLAGLALGTSAYWLRSYVHGREECSQCRWVRTVDRRGPFGWVSEPASPAPSLRFPAAESPCSDHQWVRRGCWYEDGMIGCHF